MTTRNETGAPNVVVTPPTRWASVTLYRPGTTYGPDGPLSNSSSSGLLGRGSVCDGSCRFHATRWIPFPDGPVMVRTGVPDESLMVSRIDGASSAASARICSGVG
ncbi:MAG: hypothetical protein IPF47_19315 [Gemmatimonadetes bacterium]|nr:hypothetical protein [Gemmatimonadota bacterium]